MISYWVKFKISWSGPVFTKGTSFDIAEKGMEGYVLVMHEVELELVK